MGGEGGKLYLTLCPFDDLQDAAFGKSNDTLHYTQKSASRDTIYLHDSVYVSEQMRGDTVYLTRVEYRDRWRTRVERDTVVEERVEKEVVQLPPERYMPKFYKWTAAIFWTGIALLILYLIVRSYLHFDP